MKRLAILGASGHGKVAADCAELCGWEEVSFFDDAWPALTVNGHWLVQGGTEALLARISEFEGILVAIGDNAIRLAKLRALTDAGATLAVLIHPAASVSRYTTIGLGSVVFAGAAVNVDCRIGFGAIINTGATIDHDCELGDAVHISPGAHLAGGVVVGDRSWLGIGSSVRQLVQIGSGVMVGAGAGVVANVPDDCTVAGVPARLL